MAKGVVIVVIVLIAAILTSAFVLIGIILFANIFPFGTLEPHEESYTYYYVPDTPASIEEISLDVDATEIEIQYNSTPTEYIVKANMEFIILAPDVDSYTEIFHPVEWVNTSSPVSFNLEMKTGSIVLSTNNKLTVTLRTDMVYDITASTTSGGVIASIDQRVIIDQIDLRTNSGGVELYSNDATFENTINAHADSGGVTLEFENGRIGGDIDASTSSGGVLLSVYDVVYSQDTEWTISTSSGGITIDITQYIEMGASVSGTVEANSGGVDVFYKDNLSNIGARFTGTASSGGVDFINSGGFSESGDMFSSTDYPALHNYDLTLHTDSGGVLVDGLSE
jgi:hypothetical protein